MTKQNLEDKQKEYMLLGLRKIKGISVQEFKNKFGNNPIFLFRNELSKLVEEDLLEIDVDIIKLTNKGLDLANQVWQEFVQSFQHYILCCRIEQRNEFR